MYKKYLLFVALLLIANTIYAKSEFILSSDNMIENEVKQSRDRHNPDSSIQISTGFLKINHSINYNYDQNRTTTSDFSFNGVKLGIGIELFLSDTLSTTSSLSFFYGKDEVTGAKGSDIGEMIGGEIGQTLSLKYSIYDLNIKPFVGVGLSYGRSKSAFGMTETIDSRESYYHMTKKELFISPKASIGVKFFNRSNFFTTIEGSYYFYNVVGGTISVESFDTISSTTTEIENGKDKTRGFSLFVGIGYWL